MLQRDPTLRPTAADLLHHPWICSATDTLSGCSIAGFNIGTTAQTPLTSTDEAGVTPGDTGDTVGTSGGETVSVSGGAGSASAAAGRVTAGGSGSAARAGPGFDDTLVQRLQRYGTYGRFKQVRRSVQ
jgi:hypothetical protein